MKSNQRKDAGFTIKSMSGCVEGELCEWIPILYRNTHENNFHFQAGQVCRIAAADAKSRKAAQELCINITFCNSSHRLLR